MRHEVVVYLGNTGGEGCICCEGAPARETSRHTGRHHRSNLTIAILSGSVTCIMIINKLTSILKDWSRTTSELAT